MENCSELRDVYEGLSVKQVPELADRLQAVTGDCTRWATTFRCTACGQRWIEKYVAKRHGGIATTYRAASGDGMICVATAHNPGFDIFTHPINLEKSSYAEHGRYPNYAGKVRWLADQIGCPSFLWTIPECTPEDIPGRLVDSVKTVVYALKVDESSIAAYVSGAAWDEHIRSEGSCVNFSEWSVTPKEYPDMALLVPTPIDPSEFVRTYRCDWNSGRPRLIDRNPAP